MSENIKQFLKSWGILAVEIILVLYNVISTAQVFGFNLFDLPTSEKTRFGVWMIIVVILAFQVAHSRIIDRETKNARPNIKIKEAGYAFIKLNKVITANNSYGMPSGTTWHFDSDNETTIAYNPPKVDFQVVPHGSIQAAYVDFINCPKIKAESSTARGVTANIEFVESQLNIHGKWGGISPFDVVDKRELLKTTIEANCLLATRLYIVMKIKNKPNMYGFSDDYWRYEDWIDPTTVLKDKKYTVIISLSGTNEMIVPKSMTFELENTDSGISFHKMEK